MQGFWNRITRALGTKQAPKPMTAKPKAKLGVEALEARLMLHGSGLFDPALMESPIVQPTGNAPLTIPALSSKPGSAASLYLDFNGHFQKHWGGLGVIFGFRDIVTPAFDFDGNSATFNQAEIDTITEIWQRVAEDYAPFNINVTTVEPGDFSNGVAMRIAIGGQSTDWYDPTGDAFGVNILNSFTNIAANVGYVFSNQFGNNPAGLSKTISHEAGHGFGLEHQFTSLPDRFSIMRQGVITDTVGRTVWGEGVQDDMAVLAGDKNGFGYRADDFGSTTGSAAVLNAEHNNIVGPFTQTLSRQGIIARTSDADFFAFHTEGGQVTLNVAVAAVGANLDARLELRNENGNLMASADPNTSLGATITMTLPAGKYFVVVKSHGDYGDVGQYTLTVSVPRFFNPEPLVPPGGGDFDPPLGGFNPGDVLNPGDLQPPTLPIIRPAATVIQSPIRDEATAALVSVNDGGVQNRLKKKARSAGRKRLVNAGLVGNGIVRGKNLKNKVSLDR